MNKSFQQELQKIAFGNAASKPINFPKINLVNASKGFTANALAFSGSSSTNSSFSMKSIGQKLLTALFFLFIVLVVLVFVHFFFYPIFPQWIVTNVPGLNDSVVYWKTQQDVKQISDSELGFPLAGRSSNFTVLLDVQVDYPSSTSLGPRLIAYRAPTAAGTCDVKESNTILTILPTFNFAIHLDPRLNDLYVTVLTMVTLEDGSVTTAPETINVPNFPVGKAIRLGLVMTNRFMELYMNGLLYKTRTFTGTLQDIRGDLFPIPTQIRQASTPFGRVQTLQLWNRILSSNEIRARGIAPAFPPVSRILDTNNASCQAQKVSGGPAAGPGSQTEFKLPSQADIARLFDYS